jgi:hypothetical protein
MEELQDLVTDLESLQWRKTLHQELWSRVTNIFIIVCK